MGNEVHCKSQTPQFYSMRDMNEDSDSSSWSPYHGDKHLFNRQYYNGFVQRTVTDGYPGYEKDVLKQKILEHETIFKNQVYELHRLYRVQRDITEEVKSKNLYKHQRSIETSSSSSLLPPQMSYNEIKNLQTPSFPLANPGYVRPSILGSEAIDSPSSCTKGNNSQANLIPLQNNCNSKDCAVFDSRPSKVRKKLFDLRIPADEYIDTEEEEQFPETKMSSALNYSPNGNHSLAPENNVIFFRGGGKTDGLRDTSSNSCLKVPQLLADLNEPIQIEEHNSLEFGDFPHRSPCLREIGGLDLSTKSKSQLVDLSQDLWQNSRHRSSNGTVNNLSETNKGTRRGWLSYMYEAGNYGTGANCIPKFHQTEHLPSTSQPTSYITYKPSQEHGARPTSFLKEEPWTERNHIYEFSNRSHDHSNCHIPDPVVTSHTSNPYPLYNPLDVTNSWSHSVPSWGKDPSLTEKLISLHTWPPVISSETSSRSSRQTARSPEIFQDKWHVNGSPSVNPGLKNNFHNQNGIVHGSTLGSKRLLSHLSSASYTNLKRNEIDVVALEHLTNHGSGNVLKFCNVIDLTSGTDLDLNVVPNDSFKEAPPPRGLQTLNGMRKSEYNFTALPWPREKPVFNDVPSITKKDLNLAELGFLQDSQNPLLKDKIVKYPDLSSTQNVLAASSGCHVEVKSEPDCLSKGKILGFPIYRKFCTSKNEPSSTSVLVHNYPSKSNKRNDGKHRGIDINVACDIMDAEYDNQIVAEAIVAEKGKDIRCNNIRNIDLNSCVSEDEDLLASSFASTSEKMKVALEIDLEAPVIMETVEAISPREEHKQHVVSLQSPHHKTGLQEDQVVRIAAEAIVVISSYNQDCHTECTHLDPSESSLADSLLWFADAISSPTEDPERKLCRDYNDRDGKEMETPRELDDFEVMTLQLTETAEEDYIPKPFVPEMRDLEEVGSTSLPSQTRKGPARKGRMKRDFQKDILPGIISLSRRQVTEDLQTFGGLMRATGHEWNGGLTRRNSTRSAAARGRRCVVDPSPTLVVSPVCTPLLQQFNSIELGPEDGSLTGWGKTTRRPRRQRCAAGNNLAVAIT